MALGYLVEDGGGSTPGVQPITLSGANGFSDDQVGGITSFKQEIPHKGYTSGVLHILTTYANWSNVFVYADNTLLTSGGSVGDYTFTIPSNTEHLYVQSRKYGYGSGATWTVDLS